MKYAGMTAYDSVNKYAEADTEHAHQVALFMWAAMAQFDVKNGKDNVWHLAYDSNVHLNWRPEAVLSLRAMFAIPNGGERVQAVAARMKAEGAKPGVSDVFLPVSRMIGPGTLAAFPIGVNHGLFVEMKRPLITEAGERANTRRIKQSSGKVSVDQREWFVIMRENDYACVVAYSYIEALTKIWSYLHS